MPESSPDKILRYLAKHESATGPEIARHLGITRQAVSPHLRALIEQGSVIKTGSTRAARYFSAEKAEPARRISRELQIAGLDESEVFDAVAVTPNLSRLSDNVESIELIKGKTTTKPEAHPGEGIFFVSRCADRFSLRSHKIRIEWDRVQDDVFVSEPRFLEGTLVEFRIRIDSRTRLEDVFAEFAPERYDYRFEKTKALVKLLQRDYVSRSEAKRLLHILDRFSEIELDKRDVKSVGQGFADEVFRVFRRAHPDIEVRAINASGAVDAMVRHVRLKEAARERPLR